MKVTVAQSLSLLKSGEIVAVPTETVYGLAADALQPEAVLKIFAKKERPTFHPLILHEASLERAKRWVTEFPLEAEVLAKAFWPGPLTLVLPKSNAIPDVVTGGMSSVGIRVPNHPLTLELIGALNSPIAAPSANAFGKISPTTADHVVESLQVPVLDGGPAEVGLESTILGWTGTIFKVLRLGGLPLEAIETLVPLDKTPSEKIVVSGGLKSHYQPTTPIRFREPGELPKGKKVALLSLKDPGLNFHKSIALSLEGDLPTAAKRFFESLRTLDKSGVDEIWADRMPEVGMGLAINDRLTRACHRH